MECNDYMYGKVMETGMIFTSFVSFYNIYPGCLHILFCLKPGTISIFWILFFRMIADPKQSNSAVVYSQLKTKQNVFCILCVLLVLGNLC